MSLRNGLEICVEAENLTDIKNYVRCKFERSDVPQEKANVLQTETIERANGVFQYCSYRPASYRAMPETRFLCVQSKTTLGDYRESCTTSTVRFWVTFPMMNDLVNYGLCDGSVFLSDLCPCRKRFAIVMDPDAPYHSRAQCSSSNAYVDTDEDMEKRIIDLSRGLAEVIPDDDCKIIQFVHQSVSDFLVHRGMELLENRPVDNLLAQAHLELSWSCASCIRMDEFRGIDHINYRFEMRNINDPSTALRRQRPLISYAIESWIPHAVLAKHNAPKEDLLRLFQTSSEWLQEWIEFVLLNGYTKNANVCSRGMTVLHTLAIFGLTKTLSAFLRHATQK